MKILFNDLAAQNRPFKQRFFQRLENIFETSSFVLDKNVEEFEQKFSKFSERKYSIGVSNGTDAIKLCVKCFDPSDKTLVITQANTFVATVIAALDAYENIDLKLVDIDDFFQININLLEKTLANFRHLYDKCIVIPVSMYGHTFDKANLLSLKTKYDFHIIEDCSQAHGSKFEDGTLAGTAGECSAFSLYPGKNLGSIGDAGIINTESFDIYQKIKMMRNYGSSKKYHHELFGYNHRLDSVQAAFLCEKIEKIQNYNLIRHNIGSEYSQKINNPLVKTFKKSSYCSYNTFHIYPLIVNNRDKFIKYLTAKNIQSGIHYPVLIESMPHFKKYDFYCPKALDISQKIVSLPIHPFMDDNQVEYVIEAVNNYKLT
jgi:dTDP-4-amino-4,6-dideoxygalactose transaminase